MHEKIWIEVCSVFYVEGLRSAKGLLDLNQKPIIIKINIYFYYKFLKAIIDLFQIHKWFSS
jgi:hypothetical protein